MAWANTEAFDRIVLPVMQRALEAEVAAGRATKIRREGGREITYMVKVLREGGEPVRDDPSDGTIAIVDDWHCPRHPLTGVPLVFLEPTS